MSQFANSVYLKARSPGFKLHSYYADLKSFPPTGWQVIIPNDGNKRNKRTSGIMRQLHAAVQTSSTAWSLSSTIVPVLERLSLPYTARESELEHSADITYCANHVQTKSKRWVADCEHVAALTGYYTPGIETGWLGHRLRDRSCKGFFCWSNKALENSKKVLGNYFPAEKSRIVYPAAEKGESSRDSQSFDGKIRICHITTHRDSYLENLANFYVKGTRDFLLLLKLVSQLYPRLMRKMTVSIRAWCPPSYISKLRDLGLSIEIIEHPLSRADALSYLSNSDLAVLPSHSTPTMAFVEAMSRSLPVIANDVWANSEYLLDGKTGFLVAPPEHVRYSDGYSTPLWYRPGFIPSIKSSVDATYLNRHLRALAYLLEDESVLLAMKAKTSDYFAESPFNVRRRNQRLGLLLDRALE